MNDYSLKFCIQLDDKTAEKIERLARKANISRSAVMRELVLQQTGPFEIPKNRIKRYKQSFYTPRRSG